MTSKSPLRRNMAAKRRSLDAQWLDNASAQIVDHFQCMDAFRAAQTVALYMAIGGEVNLDSLFPLCWERGKRTCIPVFNTQSKIYEMAEVSARTAYRTGNHGIREPIKPVLTALDQIDLMAVPGVAFDRAGNRLGRGGGYYDRLLAGFPGVSAAVAFEFQVLPSIPCEAHDRPVDTLVTETGIINLLNER